MKRYFSNYKIKIKNKVFNTEKEISFPKTAVLTLLDKEDEEIETVELGYIEQEEIFNSIKNRKDLFFDNCFIHNFSLDEYREKNNLPKDKLITMRNFSAKGSFFTSEKEICFRRGNFIGKRAIYSHSIFFAPKINFSKTNYEKSDADYDYITFNSPEVDFNSAVFGDYDVEFKNSIFYQGTKNFEDMRFGKGELNFLNAEFNDGDVSFCNTNFGDGRITFRVSRFGDGKIDFSRTNFGTGEISFEKVYFGKGDLTFRSANLGAGKIDFTRCGFKKGKKTFTNTNFGEGNVTFKSTNFGDGKVNFKLADFGKGNVDFHFSTFGKGDLIFERTKFHDGLLDFRGVEFGTGRISFNKIEFGNGDIIFEGSEMKSGSITFRMGVFGNGKFDFENSLFNNVDFIIDEVNFGEGKVSLKNSYFKSIMLQSSQINNYFDLRVKKCGILDLSDTIVKDILDIRSFEFKIEIEELDLTGLRLLGTIYIDWDALSVKKLIYQQDTTERNKAEQFRTLKENYNAIGMYQAEDKAYIEFMRTSEIADLKESKTKYIKNRVKYKKLIEKRTKIINEQKEDKNTNNDKDKIQKEIERLNYNIKLKKKEVFSSFFERLFAPISYVFKWFVFDKMGLYATNPLRVLFSMLVVYFIYVCIYIFNHLIGISHILYSIGDKHELPIVLKSFYFSAVTFLTIGYGDYFPVGINRFIIATEGFAGLFMMSYFTVAFVRKILR